MDGNESVVECRSLPSKIMLSTIHWNVPTSRSAKKNTYRRMVREWYDWNATVLPEIEESNTASFDGKDLADHFGAKPPEDTPDWPSPPEDQ
jgi:hypothetical protein